ncbi:MAG: oxygen-insensitive NADPH nitroreductase [SAR86 cluster bacterium]|uniref:Oxygen-insensitive NADPH nitroreductase n=1 Tax=SAR86 cluster bacterium TaxID=2030880 RepID=A0A2A5CHG8_9GAMM|nr:MAG: oxygen-insensitive NADPH nitroreductase [SAR86 cluster bacterium]
MNDVMKLMQEHSSVRSYTAEKINPSLLEELIASGQAAASSSFIQAYSIIRVVDPKKRSIIAEVAGGQSWIIEAAEFMVLCADMQRINYASHKNGEGELKGYTEHFIAATVDTALMAQNILLAAESAGLGGVFIGGIRNNPKILAETLALPDHVYPAFGLCLGWPEQKNSVKPRMPVSTILHQDSYNLEAVAAKVDAYDEAFAEYYGSRTSNAKSSDWSAPTTRAVQGKRREHMKDFLQARGFLKC